jgi:hypothetical protein
MHPAVQAAIRQGCVCSEEPIVELSVTTTTPRVVAWAPEAPAAWFRNRL